MLTLRRAADRGHADHGWLDSHHSFSFADYYDPAHMGFRVLRVINDDRVAAGGGFGTHAHRDMEIVTYVLEGALEHKDSMGNGTVMHPGDVQRMSAGTGVRHSEFNASKTDPVHFLQIWILPSKEGIPPSYAQQMFPESKKRGNLRLVVSPDGSDGSVTLAQDVRAYAAVLERGEKVEHLVRPGRHAWIQVAIGRVRLAEAALAEGDGASTSDRGPVTLEGEERAEVLVFDLP
jgi:redox-sensitive bicupin YhaK (pirin superfamily)